MSYASPTGDGFQNMILYSPQPEKVFVKFSRPIRMKKACFSWISVHKNFKNHFYPNLTEFSGPWTMFYPSVILGRFWHQISTPELGVTKTIAWAGRANAACESKNGQNDGRRVQTGSLMGRTKRLYHSSRHHTKFWNHAWTWPNENPWVSNVWNERMVTPVTNLWIGKV